MGLESLFDEAAPTRPTESRYGFTIVHEDAAGAAIDMLGGYIVALEHHSGAVVDVELLPTPVRWAEGPEGVNERYVHGRLWMGDPKTTGTMPILRWRLEELAGVEPY